MKIVAQTSTRLAIKHSPIDKWCQGSLFLVLSLGLIVFGIFYTPVSANLKCDRLSVSEINCELRQFYILRGVNKLRIFDPLGADVITIRGSKGGYRYKVMIVSPIGEFEFLPSSSNYTNNQQIATKINNFINSQQSYLSVSHHQWHDYSLFFLMIAFLFAFGIFLVISPVVNCTFYKSLNKVMIERQGLLGKQIIEYPLTSILRIDFQVKKTRYGRKIYRPVLVLNSLKQVPIYQDYTQEHSTHNAIYCIRQFLTEL